MSIQTAKADVLERMLVETQRLFWDHNVIALPLETPDGLPVLIAANTVAVVAEFLRDWYETAEISDFQPLVTDLHARDVSFPEDIVRGWRRQWFGESHLGDHFWEVATLELTLAGMWLIRQLDADQTIHPESTERYSHRDDQDWLRLHAGA